MTSDHSAPWEWAGWRDQVDMWIHAELARHRTPVHGVIEEVHTRPWSAVLRVPTTAGFVYFKAVLPRLKHEIAVTQALARWRPDCMLPVLAADIDRGWLLTPERGPRLREMIREQRNFRLWDTVLPLYAEVQIKLAAQVPELLRMGTPDHRLAALPAKYEWLLEDTETLRIDQPHGLTSDEYRRLRELVPDIARLCAELAGYGLPESLHHGDLGDANVLLSNGQPLFYDWGDCIVGHPFYSLRTTFVSLYYSLQIDDGAPELDHLRDVYLEAWTGFASIDRLRAAFKLALRLAAVNGTLVWHDVVSRLTGPTREEYAVPVPGLLQEFLTLGET